MQTELSIVAIKRSVALCTQKFRISCYTQINIGIVGVVTIILLTYAD